MTTPLDVKKYWNDRHVELAGDHRNVGDRSLNSSQNFDLIMAKTVVVSNLLGRLGVHPPAHILEAGCGAGVMTRVLEQAGFTLVGTDISPAAIEAAKGEDSSARYEVMDLSELDLTDKFDAVLCLDVLFHIVDDEKWKHSLQRMLEVLVPGQPLVIIEHFPGTENKEGSHCRWRHFEDYEVFTDQYGAVVTDRYDFLYPYRPEVKTIFAIHHRG